MQKETGHKKDKQKEKMKKDQQKNIDKTVMVIAGFHEK